MSAPAYQRPQRFPRGVSMVELTFVMAILAGSFMAILSALTFISSGMQSEIIYSEQNTRTTGTLYDVVSELREAASNSPNFYLEVNPQKPPRITFDKIDGVDANGNTQWGSIVTYRLEHVPSAANATFETAHAGLTVGRVMREESQPGSSATPLLSVVEESVPYTYLQNGISCWGFNVTCDGCALSVFLSRMGDTRVNVGADKNYGSKISSTPAGTPQASTIMQGSMAISTASGVYFLKNPQVVIPAQ